MAKRLKKPYRSGYLKVSGGHEFYYEACGNPRGKPVLFLHGGPGAGFSDTDKRFFDLKKWNLILFDQRGAGRSRPFASIHENNTQRLVKDIDSILDLFELKKVFLFGGSWGSTLSLAYAVKNAKRVTGMLLRGIYLATKEEKDYFVGGGAKAFFPEAWERFISLVPESKRGQLIEYYLKKMLSGDSHTRDKFAYEWARYEISLLKLRMNEKMIEGFLSDLSYRSLAPLEAQYMAHNCFLPDGYLLANAHKLSRIPVSIVQGRYDFICPPVWALRLHRQIKGSALHFVTAGHSSSESEIEKKLIKETERMHKLV
ncbi:MAG: prolyl aminopeptidase [Pseudomonadota bacterium]